MNLVSKLQKTTLQQTSYLIIVIALALVISTTILGVFQVQGLFHSIRDFFIGHPPVTKSEVVSVIIGGIEDKSELTTASLTTKATVKTSQQTNVLNIILGDSNLVYEAVGKVEAALDISKLEVKEVNIKSSKVYIILPPPQFTNISLDINNSRIVDQYNRWFAPNPGSELEDNAQKTALRQIVAEACNKQLLETANQNSKQIVENILRKVGYKQVIVETQAPKVNDCTNMEVSS